MSRQNQDTVISGSKMYVVLSGEVEIQLKGRQSCIPMMVSISAAQHIPSSKLKAMPPNRRSHSMLYLIGASAIWLALFERQEARA